MQIFDSFFCLYNLLQTVRVHPARPACEYRENFPVSQALVKNNTKPFFYQNRESRGRNQFVRDDPPKQHINHVLSVTVIFNHVQAYVPTICTNWANYIIHPSDQYTTSRLCAGYHTPANCISRHYQRWLNRCIHLFLVGLSVAC